MPTVLREDGFIVMIFTQDHFPEHVHVFKAEGEIIVNLLDLAIRESFEISGRDARRAQEIVAANQEFLMGEWERIGPVA